MTIVMNRLYLVVATSLFVVLCDFENRFNWAASVGVVVGLGMLLFSLSKGGGTQPIGMAAPHLMKGLPKRAPDPTANIGCAIVAAGIGSFAVANPHYPYPFRVFYAVCTAAGIVIAVVTGIRSRQDGPTTNDNSSTK